MSRSRSDSPVHRIMSSRNSVSPEPVVESGKLHPDKVENNERLSDSSADKAVMEMANLTPKTGDVPGSTVPSSGMKRADSSEALNLTLHQCARYGDESNMQTALQGISGLLKKKVNALDHKFLTPLHYAIRYNHFSVVKLLVDAGADPNMRGNEDITPLHTAAQYHKGKIKRKETNSSEEGESGEGNITATGLLQSVNNSGDSCVSFLIKNGAKVDVRDIYGQTPLHLAAMSGNEIAVRYLLSLAGNQVHAEDKQLFTALHVAAIHSQEGVAVMLIEAGANLRCIDMKMSTPLHHACSTGNVSFAQMLFDVGARDAGGWVTLTSMVTDTDVEMNTCLHLAVDNGHYDVAKLCLKKGAYVNKPRKHDIHPLHLAAMSGDIRNVKLLVEHKARIDVLNYEQATPLHKAVVFSRLDVVKYLVDHGAKINRRDKDNYTPLLLAVKYGHVETVELLLQKGADYTAVDKNDKTVIFLAAEENKAPVLRKLLSYPNVKRMIHGNESYVTNPVHVAAQEGYSEILVTLLENGALLGSRNEDQQTPLHLAAKCGRISIVRELVKRDKSSVNDRDAISNTPLHLAAMQGHDKAVTLLLELGADVTMKRLYDESTPLHLAASKGCLKACRILLEHDAPIHNIDMNKTTPLHLASRNGHAAVVSLLLKWGANVTLPDSEGLNSLSIAIENHNNDVAMVIINSEVWKDALRHSSLNLNTGHLDTPMRKLIRKMPDVAKRVFDRCLSYGAQKNPERPGYEITFNYEFLDDVYANWLASKPETSSETGSNSDYGTFDEFGRLLTNVKPYTSDSNKLKMNHPLMIMVTLSRKGLLAHPLVVSVLNHKWNTFGSVLYYLSFLFYLVFLTFLTVYIVLTRPPYNFNNTDAAAISSGSCDQLTTVYPQLLIAVRAKNVIMVLAVLHLLKELLQIYQAKLSYFSWTNLIEWITYVSALLLVIDFNDCQKETGFRLDWQWSLGAVSVFLAWMVLALFMQKYPMFGIFIVMFTEVFVTVIQVFVVFFLFIVAFSLGFYTLFQNQIAFQNVPSAMIKTGVMMMGEIDFNSIFNEQWKATSVEAADKSDRVFFPEASYLLFVIFLILMSIIAMNLLVGLAVDDIQSVQGQAALKIMAMQVDLALDVEKSLPDFIRRKTYIRCRTLTPNKWLGNPFRRLLNYQHSRSAQAIQKALNPELNEVQKGQERIQGDITNIKIVVKELQEQMSQIESMLRVSATLSKHTNRQDEDQEEQQT